MCGLAIGLGKYSNPKIIEKMLESIAHRGIRSSIKEFSNKLTIGHRRLPIQGLDTKYDMPYKLHNKCKFSVAMVGELFPENWLNNDTCYLSFLAEASKGFPDLSKTDGFFSIVVVDEDRGVLYLQTDPLSKKPLYYYRDELGLIICSEIKGITTVLPCQEIDYQYLGQVVKLGYSNQYRTPYKSIRRIPEGAKWTLDLKNGLLTRNYDRRIRDRRITYLTPEFMAWRTTEEADKYKKILEQAIKNRFRSDIPIGFLVSGGLDSSLVYCIAREIKGGSPGKVFHVDNGESEYLKFLNIPKEDLIHIPLISIADEALFEITDQPIDLGSVKPQIALSHEIQKHGIKVILTGDGADELFGGYGRAQFYDSQQSDIYDELVHYHLPRLDVCSMFGTIELRSPFLNWDSLTFAQSIPWEEYRQEKEFLKVVAKGIVPDEIRLRRKKPLKTKEIEEGGRTKRINLINKFINFTKG